MFASSAQSQEINDSYAYSKNFIDLVANGTVTPREMWIAFGKQRGHMNNGNYVDESLENAFVNTRDGSAAIVKTTSEPIAPSEKK